MKRTRFRHGFGARPRAATAPVLSRLALLCLAAACVAALSAAAAGRAGAADSYQDPLAWTRVDAKAAPVNIVVEQRGTRQAQPLAARRLLADSRELYLRSADFATALHASRRWQDTLRRLELGVGSRQFTFTGGSRAVLEGTNESLLPVPVLDHEGELWLPLAALLQVIGPAAGLDVAWDGGAGRLVLGEAADNVEALVVEALGGGTAVHVRCAEALSWSVDRPRPDQVLLTVRGARADAAVLSSAAPSGLVKDLEATGDGDRLVVALRLAEAAGEHRAYAAEGGRDIVVFVAPLPAEGQYAADQYGAGGLPAPGTAGLPDAAPARPLRTVVIDPGHGGGDTGAVGRQGTMEKDVNLAVARELKQHLERNGDLRVILTRQRDESLDLDARAEAANTAGGDLFISLHCNSWFDDQARGFETWFLSPAGSDWARSVEAVENGAAAGGREPGDVEFIVWELVQNRYITESSRFAEYLQARACRELGSPDRGVRQAGFRVLVGAYMPAVLVELGFLSHADEELRLAERGYQRQLARAIGDAVLAYARGNAAAGGEAGR